MIEQAINKVSITLNQCQPEERSDEGPASYPSNAPTLLGFTNTFTRCHPERSEGPAVERSNDAGPLGSQTTLISVIPRSEATRDLLFLPRTIPGPSGSPTSLTSVIPNATRDLLLRHQGEWRFYVYIMASRTRVLYTGMTSNLHKRVFQEKNDLIEGFTKKYKCHRLVHWESFDDVRNAINHEKEVKGWRRSKKVALIEESNPTWEDLAADWYEQQVPRRFPPRDDTGLEFGTRTKGTGATQQLRASQLNRTGRTAKN